MTREQIEAWMMLEGWELTHVRGHASFYRRAVQKAYDNVFVLASGVVNRVTAELYSDEFVEPPAPASTRDLNLIYQEITKHDT